MSWEQRAGAYTGSTCASAGGRGSRGRPASGYDARRERGVATRDFLYAALFGALPWLEWQGLWAFVLAAILSAEILLTLADFVVEIRVRKPLGDVYGGERVTHAVMGIIYGAMVANLLPVLWRWRHLPTALVPITTAATTPPELLRWGLAVMACGVFLSGMRDLYAALGMPHGGWPWGMEGEQDRS